MKRIAVFASGGGTDFQSVIDANEKNPFCEIVCLIASKGGIGAIERAERHGIRAEVFSGEKYKNESDLYSALSSFLKENKVDFIVLAGWLKIIPAPFVSEYKDRIINIHPSLIPSFCGDGYYGLKVHKAAIEYGVKVSGCTVHFVDEKADGGAIIAQRTVEVKADDTPESLQKRILEQEHILLPECVKALCEGRISKNGRTVIVKKT